LAPAQEAAPLAVEGAAAGDPPATAAPPAVEAPASGETESTSLLGAEIKEADKAPLEKPATTEPGASDDAAKPEGEPATDAMVEAQPLAPLTYEPFKAPEGVKLDDEAIKAFSELAGAAQVPQEAAQAILDRHFAEVVKVQQQAEQHQRDVWKNLNKTWVDEFRKDPELGGAREATSLALAKTAIREFGGTADQQKDLLAFFENNGAANYVGVIRLLHNAAVRLNLLEDNIIAPPPQNIRPQRGTPGSGETKWYQQQN
jgi:hypothetical protein